LDLERKEELGGIGGGGPRCDGLPESPFVAPFAVLEAPLNDTHDELGCMPALLAPVLSIKLPDVRP
jgi:hypothetical protein